ncbi:DUF397 domain-containing protein [Streptomyces echinoruber]|uniref:DUF397 domain-containing protein n=1 Tax=Streptomyces echinoruber TaxID=68898 RepID=A0A918V6H5_9ACTN|nr:DUF397 domain-containing protein [Streptomyces echinoruber]GGZ69961.1 hypothetical protein GCM10010389_04220 [Streptomyces echinoruber]
MRHTPELTSARWRRSSYSNANGGECVEVAENVPGVVPVRDSKNPYGPVLVVPAAAWDAFVSSLKEKTP